MIERRISRQDNVTEMSWATMSKNITLSDSEYRVMSIVWRHGGEACAREIADELLAMDGLSRGASYTLIHRCLEKGVLRRDDPGFHCVAILSQSDAQHTEVRKLIKDLFDGSASSLATTLLSSDFLTPDEAADLQKRIQEM